MAEDIIGITAKVKSKGPTGVEMEALTAVVGDLAGRSVDVMACLGDIVGYGASPNECVERVQKLCNLVVAGNHDWATTGQTSLDYFNPIAREACLWTRSGLVEGHMDYLKERPLVLTWEDAILVHGIDTDPRVHH